MAMSFTSFAVVVIALVGMTQCFDLEDFSYQIFDEEEFNAVSKISKQIILFHVADCEECDRVKPIWRLLEKQNDIEAIEKGSAPVVVLNVDCLQMVEFCQKQEVFDHPTIKVFDLNNNVSKKYFGKLDYSSLHSYLDNFDDFRSVFQPHRTLLLSEDNFDEITASGIFFVNFYDPKSSQSKYLAPIWDDLAKTFNNNNDLTVAKVDCVESTHLCNLLNMQQLPTLSLFEDGQLIESYVGDRKHSSLKSYILQKLYRDMGKSAIAEPVKVNKGMVIALTENNIQQVIKDDFVLVSYYKSGCSTCESHQKNLKWIAKDFLYSPITLATIDCLKNPLLCVNVKLNESPLLMVYYQGKVVAEIKDDLDAENIHVFIKALLQDHTEF